MKGSGIASRFCPSLAGLRDEHRELLDEKPCYISTDARSFAEKGYREAKDETVRKVLAHTVQH